MLCCYTKLRDIIDKFPKGVSGIMWLVLDIIPVMCSTDVTEGPGCIMATSFRETAGIN